MTPNYAGEQILLNNRANESVSGFSMLTNYGVRLASHNPEDYTLSGDGAEYFEIISLNENRETNTVFLIKLIDKKAPKGTYNLKVENVETVWEEEGEERARETFSVKIPVQVTNATPSVTVSQDKSVNLFYTDEEGSGFITVASGVGLNDVTLTECDYTMVPVSENQYQVHLKEGTAGSDKKGKITYQIPGYDGVFSKNINIVTETTAPTLVLSAKTDTLYPNSDLWYSGFSIEEKNGNDSIVLSKVEWIKDAKKKQYVELPVDGSIVGEAIKKTNTYNVRSEGQYIDFWLSENKIKKATDKLEFRVWEANWKSPVKVTYTISTVLTAPTVALSKSTITLNVNQAVYKAQSANVRASIKGMTRPDEYMNIWFVGKDAKSREILHNNLVLETWGENGDIWARFNARNDADRPKTGDYKFDVKIETLGKVYTQTLTVKIVDKPVSKCLTVKKSGSIDVLDRENTSITLKPTLSNVSGKVVYGWLEGEDADLFYSEYENNKLVIKAQNYQTLLVDHNYKVQPVFQVESVSGEHYEIRGSVQSLKLKQGKVKFMVTSDRNALYRDADNHVRIAVRALSEKGNNVNIREIKLLNYTKDLDNWYKGNALNLSHNDWYSMCEKNKTYTLKLEVTFEEQGGNVKSQTINYKLKLR